MRDPSNSFSNKHRVYKISGHQAPLWLRQSRSLGSALSSSSESLLGSRPAKWYFHMSSSASAWVLCLTAFSPRSTVLLKSSYEHVYRTHHSGLSHLELHSTISISERISSSSRLVRGWMRSTGGARKGVGVGNVRCKDGLPGVAGLPGLAL